MHKFFNKQKVRYLAVWKDNFSQTICPLRRTSRRQYNINSHQTDKCQKICPSRRFVRPLVWKRPLSATYDMTNQLWMWEGERSKYLWGNLLSKPIIWPPCYYDHFFSLQKRLIVSHCGMLRAILIARHL